jgi:hypothetical protein
VALQYLLSVLAIINRVIFLIALLAALHCHFGCSAGSCRDRHRVP